MSFAHLCVTTGCRKQSRRGQAYCEDHGSHTVTGALVRLQNGVVDKSALVARIEGTLRDHCTERYLGDADDRHVVAIIVASALAKSLRNGQ